MQKRLFIAYLFPILILGAGCAPEPSTEESQMNVEKKLNGVLRLLNRYCSYLKRSK